MNDQCILKGADALLISLQGGIFYIYLDGEGGVGAALTTNLQLQRRLPTSPGFFRRTIN